MHEGKLLVVRNARKSNYYALPGGHIDPGETPVRCIERELLEELGVAPTVGRLLYVYTFVDGEGQSSVEFLFEILNGQDFVSHESKEKTHAHELSEVRWVNVDENLTVLPTEVYRDFCRGDFPKELVYIEGSTLDK